MKRWIVYFSFVLLLPLLIIACDNEDLFFSQPNPPSYSKPALAFELIDNGTAYRVRKGTVWYGALTIPATYNGKPVKEIGSMTDNVAAGAFYNTRFTSVHIPEGITAIGAYAFSYSPGPVVIEIPASVTSIGDDAFANCDNLKAVTFAAGSRLASIGHAAFIGCIGLTGFSIPASVTSISYWAFYGCTSLTGIIIPEGVTSIESYTFNGCTSLAGITLPASVTSIKTYAFNKCASLTGIFIPEGVTSIESYAFNDCTRLSSITVDPNNTIYASENGILYNKEKTRLILAPSGISGDITIPANVTIIGGRAFDNCSNLNAVAFAAGSQLQSISGSAFSGCRSLTDITMPASVTSIGDFAFSNCTGLTSIEIPVGVTTIGYLVFNSCTSLTGITVDANNPEYASENGILYNKAKTTLVQTPLGISGNVIIPASVTSIGNHAFYRCSNLNAVTFAAGSQLQSIENDAFFYCTSLTNITMPASVTSIGDYAFSDCTSLTSIEIPASVTFIGYHAFFYWTASQTITIMGKTQAEADAAWDKGWRIRCDAVIIYED